jgi:hypothetical protein
MTDAPPDPAPTTMSAVVTTTDANPRVMDRDRICLALIGVLALADLCAVTFFKVNYAVVGSLSGGVITALFALMKGTNIQ